MRFSTPIMFAAIAAMLPTGGLAQDATTSPVGPARSAGYYVMRLGAVKVVALSDGGAALPVDTILTRTTPAHVRERLARVFQTVPTETSVNAFLIDDGARRVLVDTGAGGSLGPTAGFLQQSLRAAGYTPGDVTDVVVTHLHTDHDGGLAREGRALFPRATLHVSARDADYWLDDARRAAAPASRRATFEQAAAMLQPYRAAGRLKLIPDTGQLFPGIRTIAEPGHTVGSLAVRIDSNGETLLLLGDLLHSEPVQFAEPDIAVGFDTDQDAAIASRKAVLVEAAAKGYWLGFAHVSFPGLGHVRRDGAGYAWVPTQYGVDAR